MKALGGNIYEVTSCDENILKFTKEVYLIIKKGNYQIVHSNVNSLSAFSLLAATLAGAKIRILHNHSADSRAERARTIIKRMLRPFARLFANQYWACSSVAAEWMYGKKNVRKNKVTIINNAVELDKFAFNKSRREDLRKELNIENCFVIGHIGRFMRQKNHIFLLEIFKEVLKKNDNARLLLVGDGKLRKKLEAIVKKEGLGNKILFLGIRDDVAELYSAMDIFVLPSLYEGLPVVGIEAQASGLPFICSDRVSNEIILSENTCRIPLDAPAALWAERIMKYGSGLRMPLDDLSCLKAYDINVEAKRLENLYISLIGQEGLK